MKKISLLLSLLLMFTCTYSYAQSSTKILWKEFASATMNFDTFQPDNDFRQNFIDVKQEGNRFIWGDQNVYNVYNKKETHDGFMSFTTYTFIDKYNQRGTLIYQNNRNADWATKHMFYIQYEGKKLGMVYCSNDPQNQ